MEADFDGSMRSLATKVKPAFIKVVLVVSSVRTICINIEERPTHATEPINVKSLSMSKRLSILTLSTDAVTNIGPSVESSPSEQCIAAVLPANASKSSSNKP